MAIIQMQHKATLTAEQVSEALRQSVNAPTEATITFTAGNATIEWRTEQRTGRDSTVRR